MHNHDAVLPDIAESLPEMLALRHKIHAHPELAYEEFATSDLVCEQLESWGYAIHRGLGGTGVVATLRKGQGGKSIGVRADMDALPIHEATGLPYASKLAGKMHACGHDGHTATLLAAARQLARNGEFNGTLNLIFQPAEEGLAGARKMMEDGLFEKFPCDAIFAYHNMPGFPVGKFGFMEGGFMASSDTVIVKVNGVGGHGAMPATTVDAVVVASYIVVALQTIVSRNVDPREMAVISVGSIHAGNAPNVIAGSAELRLTVRAFNPAVRALLRERITKVVHSQAEVLGATAEIDYQWRYPPLQNEARDDRLRAPGGGRSFWRRLPDPRHEAADRQRGLRLHARAEAGLLFHDRQRRWRGRLHGAQPGLRLQRRHPADRRELLGQAGGALPGLIPACPACPTCLASQAVASKGSTTRRSCSAVHDGSSSLQPLCARRPARSITKLTGRRQIRP